MRKYLRKTNRGSYDKEKLREAVEAVKSGRMSGYTASKTYQIPRMTIMDHAKKSTTSLTLGRYTALSPEIECKIATSLHLMENNGFGLSRVDVLQMVRDYIKQNNLITSFKNDTPGKDWFLAFKERHGITTKRQPVDYIRKRPVDPVIIYSYFDLLEKTIRDLNLQYQPSSIWNFGEMSFTSDSSSDGTDDTTVLLGASASGEKAPPLIVYKGNNLCDAWTSLEAYTGTSYAVTMNGRMESEVFESFFKESFLPFIQNMRPVLLIYDGNSTNIGLNVIEEAQKENITILKLPPHTSHLLQPLDIAVTKPFVDSWDSLLVLWQRLNAETGMPKSEFAKLIGQVWSETDPQILCNRFRKTGICPVNRGQIEINQFDTLKLKHWRENESDRIIMETEITKKDET